MTNGIGLEQVGVHTDSNGAILVDEWYIAEVCYLLSSPLLRSCTNIPSIFAVGDCTVLLLLVELLWVTVVRTESI